MNSGTISFNILTFSSYVKKNGVKVCLTYNLIGVGEKKNLHHPSLVPLTAHET